MSAHYTDICKACNVSNGTKSEVITAKIFYHYSIITSPQHTCNSVVNEHTLTQVIQVRFWLRSISVISADGNGIWSKLLNYSREVPRPSLRSIDCLATGVFFIIIQKFIIKSKLPPSAIAIPICPFIKLYEHLYNVVYMTHGVLWPTRPPTLSRTGNEEQLTQCKLQGKGLLWLIGLSVCLLAEQQIISIGKRWPHSTMHYLLLLLLLVWVS